MLSTTVARTSLYRCVVAYADCLDSAGGETHGEQSGSKQGAVPMVMSPTQFEKYLNDDIAKWTTVIKTAGIHLD